MLVGKTRQDELLAVISVLAKCMHVYRSIAAVHSFHFQMKKLSKKERTVTLTTTATDFRVSCPLIRYMLDDVRY